MAFCWVRYCENYKRPNPNIVLYPAPDRRQDRIVWSKAFGIPLEFMNQFTRICSAHFLHRTQLENLYTPGDTPNSCCPSNHEIRALKVSPEVQPISPPPALNLPDTNEIPNSETISDINHSDTKSFSKMRNLLTCNLLLDCHEEDLSQIQQNFHSQEWLNYCKYNTTINNLPSVRTANVSEFEKLLPNIVASSSELPVLVFSNAPPPQKQIPQNFLTTILNNSVPSNVTPILQIPPAVSSISSTVSSISTAISPISPAVIQHNIQPTLIVETPASVKPLVSVESATGVQPLIGQPAVSIKSNIFPVCLEENASEKASTLLPEESVFPLVLQESLKDLIDPLKNTASATLKNIEKEKHDELETLSSPLSSDDAGNNECISPDLLKNFEVNFHESDGDTAPVSNFLRNTSQSLSSELALDELHGPKILNVISGDAGAQEYYKDDNDFLRLKIFEVDPETQKEKNNTALSSESLATEKTMPKTVTQWSIFSMQKTIAVISSGSLDASTYNLLNLRTLMPPLVFEKDGPKTLMNRLRDEGFMTSTPWWLVKKGFLPLTAPCISCRCPVFKISSRSDYPDKLCWICDACSHIVPVKRPKFFERFPMLSLEELLLLTYHWSIKSRPYAIKRDVDVNDDVLFNYFTALQEICSEYISKYCQFGKVSTSATTVEVSAVKFGKFFVICAFCRRTKLTRMQALTTEEACCTIAHIKVLEQMLGNYCTLITWKKINDCFLPGITKWCADPTVTSVLSTGRHILNASKYLGKTLIELFQKISHDQLSLKVIQGYLDEVQWRDRFGKIEESAFWNIMNEISRLNESYFTETQIGKIEKDRYFYKQDVSFQKRWSHIQNTFGLRSPASFSISGSPSYNVTNSSNYTVLNSSSSTVLNPPNYTAPITPNYTIPISGNYTVPSSVNYTVPSFSNYTVPSFSNYTVPSSSNNTVPNSSSIIVPSFSNSTIPNSSNYTVSTSSNYTAPVSSNSNFGGLLSEKIEEVISKGLKGTPSRLPISLPLSSVIDKPSVIKVKHPVSLSAQNVSACPSYKSYDKEFPVIRASLALNRITAQELLSIKISFHEDRKIIELLRKQAFKLGEKLRSEHYLQKPVRWLVNKKLISNESVCYVCKNRATLLDNPKYPDGVSWLCEKTDCKFQNMYRRPAFFTQFGFPLEVIFSVIYHWAVQSSYVVTVKSIPLNEFNIICIQRQLQKLCSEISKRPSCKVGGKRRLVEVALVKFSNCFILGAMERETKLSRFRSFTIESKLHIDNIRKTLMSWLLKESTVIVNSNKYLGAYCMEEKINLVFADRTVKDVNSKKYHTLTISNYLQNHMKNMFAMVKVQHLTAELLQVYLDELVWRERYGRSPLVAFRNIMQDIFIAEYKGSNRVPFEVTSQNGSSSSSFVTLPEVKVVLDKLPDHVIEKYCSSATYLDDEDEIEIIESIERKETVKEEVIISDDEAETLTPNSEENVASSSTTNNVEDIQMEDAVLNEMLPDISEIKLPLVPVEPFDSEIQEVHQDGKRYSDKCYSHKRRMHTEPNSKFKCIECKGLVTSEHFTKLYSCDDCKYCIYTTFCQRAYAEHRSCVLFGKKKSPKSKNSRSFHRNVQLKQWLYCSCGFSSQEGNKMASHLIGCEKTTCYSSYNAVSTLL